MNNNYSTLDQIFHRVVLGSPMFGDALGSLDSAFSKGPAQTMDRPVYVTGLARAGTTVLMRSLYETDKFASLLYRDMPMVMAPALWERLSKPFSKKRVSAERAHKDGIDVDYDSPEALEEVFWRVHCGSDFITDTALVRHSPDEEVLDEYQSYVERICAVRGRSRYLCKNNNLILRLDSILDRFPDSKVLMVLRDPFSQAKSMLTQNTRFHGSDTFTQSYMGWLAHHEFGDVFRPFKLGPDYATGADLSQIDFWLLNWINYYDWVLSLDPRILDQVYIVSYERLCADPAVWDAILETVEIDAHPRPDFRGPKSSDLDFTDAAMVKKAKDIYKSLSDLSL